MNTTTTKKKTAAKAKKIHVIVAWINDWSAADTVNTLGYDGGRGPVRVYEKDNYDSRMDLGNAPGSKLPYFEHAPEALLWMAAHRDQHIQLDTNAALSLGFSKKELAAY
jgi:hypothetical protein